jgi:O-succinylbenzoic acid--CoA ligase
VKLHPEEIEKKLSRFIDRPFYIAGRPSKLWGEEAVLYIEGCDIDRDYIMEKARSVLDRYSVPKDVIAIPNFSRTDSGKIKRL